MMYMLGDFFMKSLQGGAFKNMRNIILNMPNSDKATIEHRSVLSNEKKYKNVSTEKKNN